MRSVSWILIVLATTVSHASAEGGRVAIVLLDDVGRELLDDAPTPNLDRLAAAGRRYTVAWGGPACSNARSQIVSGLFPSRPASLVGSNVKADGEHALAPGPQLVPARVTGAGLRAAHLGKWHLSPTGRKDHARECGYSRMAGTEGNLPWGGGKDYFEWEKITDGVLAQKTGYVTSDTIDDALVEVAAGTQFIFVALHATHNPLHCPPPELAPTSPCTKASNKRQKRVAALEAADAEVGRFSSAALEAGYVVFLTSDNSERSVDGGKHTLYESGLRVPWVVTGPGVAPGTSETLVALVDIGPTALDLLGVDADPSEFDGLSLAEELRGERVLERTLYAESFRSGGPPGPDHQRAIRDRRWKLHTGPGYPKEEFYDLLSDPHEGSNLMEGELDEEQSAALAALRKALPK